MDYLGGGFIRRFFRRKRNWKELFEEARALGSNRHYERAVKKFRAAIELAPEQPYPHYDLGYTLFRMGRFEEALEELRETRRLSPGFFLVSTDIYVCECILDGRLSPEYADAIRMIQQMIDRKGDKRQMNALSRKLIDSVPDCPLCHYYLAKTLEDPEESRVALEKCLALNPDSATALWASVDLGMALEALGNPDHAMKVWRDAVQKYKGVEHTQLCELIITQREQC